MKKITTVLLVALIAACAAKPVLTPRSGGNPEGVDLSGQWALRGGPEIPTLVEQTIVIPRQATARDAQLREQRMRRDKRSKGRAVHVFMESGKSLKISQTAYGVFISYDRAVVEEYNFGENRRVSVGPIEAQRVSGWVGREFIVETMDDEGNVLKETWRLEEGGSVLVRNMSITKREEEKLALRQVFDRE